MSCDTIFHNRHQHWCHVKKSMIAFLAISKTGSRTLLSLLPSKNVSEIHILPFSGTRCEWLHGTSTPPPPPLVCPFRTASIQKITMLRRPLSRLISEHTFDMHFRRHAPCTVATFQRFAKDMYRRNWQTAFLAGKRWIASSVENYLNATRADVSFLKRQMDAGEIITGVFELFDLSIQYIFDRLRLPRPQNARAPLHLPPCTRTKMHDNVHELDIDLWNYAHEKIRRET